MTARLRARLTDCAAVGAAPAMLELGTGEVVGGCEDVEGIVAEDPDGGGDMVEEEEREEDGGVDEEDEGEDVDGGEDGEDGEDDGGGGDDEDGDKDGDELNVCEADGDGVDDGDVEGSAELVDVVVVSDGEDSDGVAVGWDVDVGSASSDVGVAVGDSEPPYDHPVPSGILGP